MTTTRGLQQIIHIISPCMKRNPHIRATFSNILPQEVNVDGTIKHWRQRITRWFTTEEFIRHSPFDVLTNLCIKFYSIVRI